MIDQKPRFDLEKSIIVYSKRPKLVPKHCQTSKPKKSPKENPLTTANLYLPMAPKKVVQSCTKHSLTNFITYFQLSAYFRAFPKVVDRVNIIRDVQEALNNPKWSVASHEEMKALIDNGTQDVIDLPKNKKTIWCKGVFTVKYKVDGNIKWYKARLVAHGFTQAIIGRS